jgi:PAS domain S-box-containing protein
MNENLRRTGIDIIGDVPWGTHIGQFYNSKEDLTEILVPYFKAGLENNEFCIWITAQPLEAEDAKKAIRKAVPHFDSYLAKGQIEIISYTCTHVVRHIYDSERAINYLIEKLNHALESGYSGLRFSVNISWVGNKDWGYFVDYMGKLDDTIGKYRMIALDSYLVDRYSTIDIVEMVSNHQFSLSKKEGKWEKINNFKRTKDEEVVIHATKDWKYTFDAVPDLIAILDTEFRIVRANKAMAASLGITPEECIGLTCYRIVHGLHEPPFFCPHRQLLNDGLEHTAEIYEDHLGGYFIVSATPLHDSEGKLTGCIHVARNINERKVAEDKLGRSEQRIKMKLENILSPARKMENLILADVIDVQMIQSLMNDFYKLAHIPIGINDLKGNVLAGAGWQDICTKFHRVHPETSKYCVESDTNLSLIATPGELKMYKCKNNMWDIVTPIILDGQHVGYVFSGQFFFDDEPLDYEFFRSQTRKYDFNEEEYMAALNKVPRLSRETVDTSMAFLMTFANTISKLSYNNFKLAQLLAERDHLVNALRESENRELARFEELTAVLDAVPVTVLIAHDPQALHITGNKLSYELFQISKDASRFKSTPEGEMYEPVSFFKDIEQNQPAQIPLRMAAAGTEVHDYEFDIVYPHGGLRHLLGNARSLRDEQGTPRGSVAAFIDITERKEVEETLKKAYDNLEKLVEERTKQLEQAYNSLKESEKRLAEAQKMSHIGHWEWDIITDKAYWSDELYSIFRRHLRELAPTYNEYLSYVHPKDRDHVANAFKKAIYGKPYSIDHRILLANGEERAVHIQSEVIFDEKKNPIRVKGVVQDITERKKAEEKIQSLANIVGSSNDAIITMSLNGIITSWNKGAEQIYGYSSEEILGKNVSLIAPDNLKNETKQLVEKVKLGEKIQHYITSRLRKDGKLIYVSIALSPVFDASRELVAISAIARDITLHIESEKSLVKAEKARKKELHHRIKNNLQVISSLLDLQAEKFKNRECITNSEVLEAFRESQDRVISMALIHEELYKGEGFETLDFSKYIRELVENLFQTYRLDDKNICLHMDMEENILLNMDNAVPFGIIVNELVSNSLKHAFSGRDKGKICIKLCRVEDGELINSREESKCYGFKGNSFILKISDDGVGIPKSVDLENPNSLGMQLVTTLVDQLDGKLELKRNKETEFTIKFTVTKKEKSIN